MYMNIALSLAMDIIYHEDAERGLNTLDTPIHLTVTSPPYFNVKDYVSYTSYEEYLDTLRRIFASVYDKTINGRMCCVNLSNILIPRASRSHESKRIPLAFHFVGVMESIGWKFIEDIIWVKPEGAAKNRNGGFFQHRQPMAYKPNTVNEYILVFQKPSPKLIDAIVRSYDAYTANASEVDAKYERSNIWYINPETRSKHPAPYPVDLVERLIRYYSYVGDVVLDPFMGSGTTAVVAKQLNRHWVGYDLHQEYIDMANERLKKTIPTKLPPPISIPIFATLAELRTWSARQQKRTLQSITNAQHTMNKREMINQIVEKWTSTH
jgi:DNA modification methylase